MNWHGKSEKVCRSAAKPLFAKEISMDRREPGAIHQNKDKYRGMEGISETDQTVPTSQT